MIRAIMWLIGLTLSGAPAEAGQTGCSDFVRPGPVTGASDYVYAVWNFRYAVSLHDDRWLGDGDTRVVGADFEVSLCLDLSEISEKDIETDEHGRTIINCTVHLRRPRMIIASRRSEWKPGAQTRFLGWLYESGIRDKDWETLDKRANLFIETCERLIAPVDASSIMLSHQGDTARGEAS